MEIWLHDRGGGQIYIQILQRIILEGGKKSYTVTIFSDPNFGKLTCYGNFLVNTFTKHKN